MTGDKALLEKSLDVLREKSEECADLAKTQRTNADKQHETAHKLEVLGHSLADDAAEIEGEIHRKEEDAPQREANGLLWEGLQTSE